LSFGEVHIAAGRICTDSPGTAVSVANPSGSAPRLGWYPMALWSLQAVRPLVSVCTACSYHAAAAFQSREGHGERRSNHRKPRHVIAASRHWGRQDRTCPEAPWVRCRMKTNTGPPFLGSKCPELPDEDKHRTTIPRFQMPRAAGLERDRVLVRGSIG
jgi:hypothetical protein